MLIEPTLINSSPTCIGINLDDKSIEKIEKIEKKREWGEKFNLEKTL